MSSLLLIRLRTILRWWWWLSQQNFFHVPAFSLLTFCLTLKKLRRVSRWCKSFRVQAWPESWTPTHGDVFVLRNMTAWAICIYLDTPSPSVQPTLWEHFSLPVSPTLWTDPSAEKSPTYQNSSSTQGFLRVSRKMVLVLSNFSWGKHRGLSKMLHLPEKPKLLVIDLEPS